MALEMMINVSEQVKNQQDATHSISMGNSPFQDGVKFTVTGYGYRHPKVDGKILDKTSPVLTTTIGDLFLTMVTRSKVTADGQIIAPNGTFNKAIADKIAELNGKTNGEILTAIVKMAEGKEITVTREAYIAGDGTRRYPATIIHLNFV